MNTPSHTPTPGPWTVDNATGQILGPRDGCSHVIVARMPVWWSGQKTGSHASQDQQAVNAALIASAPTLLAQRNALLEALQQCREIAEQARLAVNAIVEAKPGRDQDAAAAVARGHCLTITGLLAQFPFAPRYCEECDDSAIALAQGDK